MTRMSKENVGRFFAALAAERPDPTTELAYINAYTLLVAVVLSAQATDVGVNKATAELFKTVNTPAKMIAFGEAKLRDAIKTIGLYCTKAANVIRLSEILAQKHGGEVPASREALEELPGVGRKTANVVLNVAFGQPTIAVDTHIFRLGNRTGLSPGKDPRAVEEALEAVVPEQYLRHAHHWLILHGRYVCTARNPKCAACVVRDLCLYEAKTTADVPAAASASPGRRPSNRGRASSARATGRRAPRRARRRGATSRGGTVR